MFKVRIKIKDRNKTDMSERIKKKCMHVHVITHMILAHNPLLPPFRFREWERSESWECIHVLYKRMPNPF